DHDHRFRFRVFIKQLQRINKVGSNNRIAPNADCCRLSNAALRKLVHRLIGQSSRTGNDPDISFLVDMPGHDADLAFSRRNDSGTVWSNQPRLAPELQIFVSAHHVQRRNAFRDADNQWHLSVHGFHDGVSGKRRRNKDHRCIRACFVSGFLDCIEHRPAFMRRAAFSWCYSADDLCAIRRRALGVKRSFASRNPLNDKPCRFVYQNCHFCSLDPEPRTLIKEFEFEAPRFFSKPSILLLIFFSIPLLPLFHWVEGLGFFRVPVGNSPYFAAEATFSAASFMFSATIKFSPELRRISRPCSTFVPSRRSTSGNFRLVAFAASTTALASMSTRRIPPKILISSAFTFLSLNKISNACWICSALAPPPTSRKFAGEPPAYLMMSMVAMASPAPFTMQAMLPSSLM